MASFQAGLSHSQVQAAAREIARHRTKISRHCKLNDKMSFQNINKSKSECGSNNFSIK